MPMFPEKFLCNQFSASTLVISVLDRTQPTGVRFHLPIGDYLTSLLNPKATHKVSRATTAAKQIPLPQNAPETKQHFIISSWHKSGRQLP